MYEIHTEVHLSLLFENFCNFSKHTLNYEPQLTANFDPVLVIFVAT